MSADMPARDRKMRTVAEGLWQQTLAREPGADASRVTEMLFMHIDVGLRRWVGAEGFASLLSRAVAETVETHPILAHIPDFGVEPAAGDDVPPPRDAVDEPRLDPDALREAIQSLLVAMTRRLGDIIGDNMAIRLMEQSGTPAPRGTATTEPNELLL